MGYPHFELQDICLSSGLLNLAVLFAIVVARIAPDCPIILIIIPSSNNN